MKYRIVSIILAAAVSLCGMVVWAADTVTFDVSLDMQTDTVRVTGTGGLPGDRVTLVVLLPNAKAQEGQEEPPAYTLSDLTEENAKDRVYFADTAVVDEEESFSFSFAMSPEKPGGFYQVIVGVEGVQTTEEQRTKPIFYPSAEEKQEALKALNGADSESISAAVERLRLIASLTDEGYNKVKQTADGKMLLLCKLAGEQGFSTIEDAVIGLRTATLIGLIEDELVTEADVKMYGGQIGLILDEAFDSVAGEVVQRMKGTDGLDSAAALESLVQTSTALSLVHTVSRADLSEVITQYAVYLEIENKKEYITYKNMDEEKQLMVNSKLEHTDFDAASEFADAFCSVVKEQQDEQSSVGRPNTSRPSGGGGGGSYTPSKGNSSTVVMPVEQPEEPSQPEKSSVFTDIDSVAWAKEAIEVFCEKKFVSGMSETEFAPNERVTREQFIKMLVLTFDLLDMAAEHTFSDCRADAWYTPYVASAQQAGITKGKADGTFGVGEEISRQDMAVMLERTLNVLEIELPQSEDVQQFSDYDTIAPYAQRSVSALQKMGIFQGNAENQFQPSAKSTRAEAVVTLYRIWKNR